MAREKYLLRRAEAIIALRRDFPRENVMVAGARRAEGEIKRIAKKFGGGGFSECTRQGWRARVSVMGVRDAEWEAGIRLLRAVGWSFEQVHGFGRLTR